MDASSTGWSQRQREVSWAADVAAMKAILDHELGEAVPAGSGDARRVAIVGTLWGVSRLPLAAYVCLYVYVCIHQGYPARSIHSHTILDIPIV